MHTSCNPACQNLAALLFTQAGTREVAAGNKSDNVDNKLVLVKNGVDNHRNNGGEEVFALNFHEDDNKTTGLEDGASID